MKRRQFLEASAAGATLLLAPPASAQTAPTTSIAYSNWDGLTPLGAPEFGGDRWGVPELWWYGRATAFSSHAEVRVHADDATSFTMQGRAPSSDPTAVFGVTIQWGRPFTSGYSYKFILRMTPAECLPDFITVNDNVIWKRATGYTSPMAHEVECEYVPSKSPETVTLRLFRNCGTQWAVLHPPHQNFWSPRNLICQRGSYSGPQPTYPTLVVPSNAQIHQLDSYLACAPQHEKLFRPASYAPANARTSPYPTSRVKIVERGIVPVEGARYAKIAGIDIWTYQPRSAADAGFETFAKAAAATGVRELLVSPVLLLKDLGLPNAAPDRHQFFHWHSLMRNATPVTPNLPQWSPTERKVKIAQAAKECCRLIKRWLELVPDGRAMMFEIEANGAYGNYGGGIADSEIRVLPGYEHVVAGGAAAWRLTFQFFQDLRRQCLLDLGPAAARFKILANCDRAAFQGAYCYHAGADIVLHKNIHRQNVNIVVANSRGAAASYGREYGYDFDAWDRNYWGGYPLREIEHGLLVYFHAGAGYLMDEIPVWSRNGKFLSEYGPMWLNFCRYAKSHPRRGTQQVRIAVMRALGDEWNKAAGPSAGWEASEWLPRTEISRALQSTVTPPRWAKAKRATVQGRPLKTEDTYLWDYSLLRMLFADFGSPARTDPNRLYTGTPYGPVNFIPWDTPAEKLAAYRVVLFLGNGYVDAQTASHLEHFVEHGGHLVMAAGQLRGDDGEFVVRELAGVKLGPTRTHNELPYSVLSASEPGVVTDRLPNGDAMAIQIKKGQGSLTLFSGEFLTHWDDAAPAQAIRPLLDTAKLLDFEPASDWLEYSVRRKQDTWIFAIFHHGRGFSPSGNGTDHGPWTGEVVLDLRDLELQQQGAIVVSQVVREPDAEVPFHLAHVASSQQGARLSFAITIAEFEEIIVGPSTRLTNDFFESVG